MATTIYVPGDKRFENIGKGVGDILGAYQAKKKEAAQTEVFRTINNAIQNAGSRENAFKVLQQFPVSDIETQQLFANIIDQRYKNNNKVDEADFIITNPDGTTKEVSRFVTDEQQKILAGQPDQTTTEFMNAFGLAPGQSIQLAPKDKSAGTTLDIVDANTGVYRGAISKDSYDPNKLPQGTMLKRDRDAMLDNEKRQRDGSKSKFDKDAITRAEGRIAGHYNTEGLDEDTRTTLTKRFVANERQMSDAVKQMAIQFKLAIDEQGQITNALGASDNDIEAFGVAADNFERIITGRTGNPDPNDPTQEAKADPAALINSIPKAKKMATDLARSATSINDAGELELGKLTGRIINIAKADNNTIYRIDENGKPQAFDLKLSDVGKVLNRVPVKGGQVDGERPGTLFVFRGFHPKTKEPILVRTTVQQPAVWKVGSEWRRLIPGNINPVPFQPARK